MSAIDYLGAKTSRDVHKTKLVHESSRRDKNQKRLYK